MFEVCERMALGFDVTYSHIMTFQAQEGRDVTFRAFEVMSLRMGIPSSESPTGARHGGTQHPTCAHARYPSARENPSHRILTYQSNVINIL